MDVPSNFFSKIRFLDKVRPARSNADSI